MYNFLSSIPDALYTNWNVMFDVMLIFILIILAKFIKETLPIFKKVIIPTALIATFLGFIIGDQVLGLVHYNRETIKVILFHSVAIGFIALTLRYSDNKAKKSTWSTGALIISIYMLQAIVGILITMIFFPNIFDGAGILLTMGFGQGPGLANSIGSGWEDKMVDGLLVPGLLPNGSSVGLMIAVFGFLWGGIFGVIMVNIKRRKKSIPINNSKIDTDKYEDIQVKKSDKIRTYDSLTAQVGVILFLYMLSYITIYFIAVAMESAPASLKSLGDLLIGFNYLFGIVYAIAYKKIRTKFFGISDYNDTTTNNYILNNITSLAFNVMITCSLMAVTLDDMDIYFPYILVLTSIGGLITFGYFAFVTKRIYKKEYRDEYQAMLFGQNTGTAATGMSLLKILDPNLETPAAEDAVVGGANALMMAVPVLALLPMVSNGKTLHYLIFLIVYFTIVNVVTLVKTKK